MLMELLLPAHFGDEKRYYNLNTYLRSVWGGKVCKLPVGGGFTCPNRDGTKGWGGCFYCSEKAGGEFAADAALPIAAQIESERCRMEQKWPGAGYIAYFQAFTNTHAPLAELREKYEEAIRQPGVVGLSVATRADALPDEVVDYLAELCRRTHLTVELGLQTVHDATAHKLNRCHSYAEFLQGYYKLQSRGIRTCIHLINSLPGETPAMMRESARQAGLLRPQGIKLHMLYIQHGTALAGEWKNGGVSLFTREEYIALVCDQLELLPETVVIERLTGDPDARELLAPLWVKNKRAVLNGIDRELRRRGSWQGCKAN